MKMEELSIGQICSRFSSGRNITTANIHESGLYPVYGSNGLRGFTDSYNYDGECAIVGRQGAYCGNVKYVSGKSYMSEHAIVAKTNPNHNNKYFAYKLSLAKLGRFSGQAAQPGLSVTKLLRLKFEMPSKQYQDRIASILSAYDSLIENNTKRIRLLEKMAENLYKEWFVRFRFPGYEKAEMENGLPKGWTVEKVKDWCRVFTGRKDVNQSKEDGQYVFFSCSPNTFHSDEFIYDGKAILVAGNGSYTGRTRYFEGKFDLYQRTYAVVSNKEDDSFMFYLYLRFKFDFEPMHSGGTRGSAIPYIVMKDLTKYKFLYKKDIVEAYIKKVKPMFAEADNLQRQNALLARQRDLLLPRLMSGKLEVKP